MRVYKYLFLLCNFFITISTQRYAFITTYSLSFVQLLHDIWNIKRRQKLNKNLYARKIPKIYSTKMCLQKYYSYFTIIFRYGFQFPNQILIWEIESDIFSSQMYQMKRHQPFQKFQNKIRPIQPSRTNSKLKNYT